MAYAGESQKERHGIMIMSYSEKKSHQGRGLIQSLEMDGHYGTRR